MDEVIQGPDDSCADREPEHEVTASLPVEGGSPSGLPTAEVPVTSAAAPVDATTPGDTWWYGRPEATSADAPAPSQAWTPTPPAPGPSAGDVPADEPAAAPWPWQPQPPADDRQAPFETPPSWGPPPVWGMPPAPAPVWGAPGDDGPGGMQPPQAPLLTPGGGDDPAKASRRLRRLVLVGVSVVLVLGAVAGGVLIGRHSNPPHTTTASETIPSPGKSGSPGTSAKINVAAIAARVDPAVVDITSVLGASSTGDEAAGTGMILTSNGEVLTNNHVIADATSITAQINGSGRVYRVFVLGTDVTQDVALVQLVGASGLPTVAIGDSSKLQLGDPVVAIGNALDLKGPETVTQGIVSALGRSITASDSGTGASENLSGLIQTDAPINPGNSGGPLLNANGQVVGMDTAAATGSSTQAATDIGFAIPINTAIGIAQRIQEGKGSHTVLIDNKGFLGVQVISIAEAESAANGFYGQVPAPGASSGAYVAGVLQGTPAVEAGLQVGDVITGVDGQAVANPQDLGTILSAERPGDSVTVTWVTPSKAHETATAVLVAHPVA